MERKIREKTTMLLINLILVLQLLFCRFGILEASENQIGPRNTESRSNDESNCNYRMGEIEDKNHEQEKEISNLKTTVVEDRKMINLLSERVARLEGSVQTGDLGSDTTILARSKRPYRLIPVQAHKENAEMEIGSKNNDENNSVKELFYGPATSCDELGRIGYTLNGFYLVNGKKDSKTAQIYCYFKNIQKEGSDKNKEERFGVVSLNAPTAILREDKPNIFSKSLDITTQSLQSAMPNMNSTPSSNFAPSTKAGNFKNRIEDPMENWTIDTMAWNKSTKCDGTRYLLKNGHGKCMAVSSSNPKLASQNGSAVVQSDCNPSKKGQLWMWKKNRRLCNDWDKCLSVINYPYVELWENIDGKLEQVWHFFQNDLLTRGLCVIPRLNSAANEAQMVIETCAINKKGKSWNFYKEIGGKPE